MKNIINLKLLYFLMQWDHLETLEDSNIRNIYYDFNNRFNDPFIEKLAEEIKSNQFTKIKFFEIEDKPFEKEILLLVNELEIAYEILKTPMFIDTRESFKEFIGDKTFILQASYYKKARKEMDLLLEDGKPLGGKWSQGNHLKNI